MYDCHMQPNRKSNQYIAIWENASLLRTVVENSHSIREAILNLGVSYSNSAVKTFKARCAQYGIDLADAFPNRYNYHLKTIPDEEVFVIDSPYVNNKVNVKKRALANGWLKNECSKCGLGPEWQDEPLVLQLDHINGESDDHRIENLRILCPNCHTQTWSYAGKRRLEITVKMLTDDELEEHMARFLL